MKFLFVAFCSKVVSVCRLLIFHWNWNISSVKTHVIVFKSSAFFQNSIEKIKNFYKFIGKFLFEFCGFQKIPSHDTLSKFEKKFSYKFVEIFNFLDGILEKSRAFENDDMSFDGTDIPVPMKNKQSAHRYHFGAKSDKK